MAFIGEAFVTVVIEELTRTAIDQLKEEIKLYRKVKDELANLTKHLLAVQSVLADAERKQLKDSSIEIWLDELKDVSYEMDDVIGEWRSAMLIKSLDLNNRPNASSRWKQWTFIPSWCKSTGKFGLRRHNIAHKIKELNERLELISHRKNMYGLTSNLGVGPGTIIQRRTTITRMDGKNVQGREKEMNDLVEKLLGSVNCSELAVPHVISVVGFGGLGKTTLAKKAFDDVRVGNHFQERIWVSVSDPFDETRIAKEILEYVEKKAVGVSQWHPMVEKIKIVLGGKKFLLVLDDVWNEDQSKWQTVNSALTAGSPGSMVLVTTRKERVATTMDCAESNRVKLKPLTKDQCWLIISNEVEASIGKEKLPQFKEIGSDIADKCKGLPLAAKSLGSLLRFKRTKEEWKAVLDSEMWQLGAEEAEIGENLFASLWLSYHELSPNERQCLSYCACFRKATRFRKDHLIKLWMAQGYIKEGRTKDMTMVAEEYFGNMCSRSFFQNFEFERYDDCEIESFKMHDLVHDFCIYISSKECLCFEADKSERLNSVDERLDSIGERLDSVDEAISHFFIFLNSSVTKFPTSPFCFKRLRSLAVHDCGELDLKVLLRDLKSLRSLALINCNLKEIPSILGGLIHLRLLDLRNNAELRKLPDTSGLCNLIIVDLRRCPKVERMPTGMGNLCNLRYLYTDDDLSVPLTEGIGRIKTFREVSFLVDGSADDNSEATSLANLKNMGRLKSVRITLRGNAKDMVDGAKHANLSNKKKLVNLKLCFELDTVHEKVSSRKYGEIIEALRPCSCLHQLEIIGYRGFNLKPSWLLSLNDLTRVELVAWRNCSELPPLGRLPSLTFLRIKSVKVKKVGPEFLGGGVVSDGQKSASSPGNDGQESTSSPGNDDKKLAFPKLKWLTFEKLQDWEEWNMDESNLDIMPKLTDLTIFDCKKLKALPDLFYERKFKFDIRGTPVLREHSPAFGRTKLKRRKAYRRRILK